MKQRTLFILLSFEAILFSALTFYTKFTISAFPSIVTFPFEQIATGLIHLSNLGSLGNGISVTLWIGISSIPFLLALRKSEKTKFPLEILTLIVLSVVLMITFYGLINPDTFFKHLLGISSLNIGLTTMRTILCVSAWSFIVLYFIIKFIILLRTCGQEDLLVIMKNLLYVLSVLFVANASTTLTKEFVSLLEQSDTLTFIDWIGVHLRAIPSLLNIVITILSLNLLRGLIQKDYILTVKASNKLSKFCYLSLGITSAITAIFNVIQLIFSPVMTSARIILDIPIINIILVCIVLILKKLVLENKKLEEDNGLFI